MRLTNGTREGGGDLTGDPRGETLGDGVTEDVPHPIVDPHPDPCGRAPPIFRTGPGPGGMVMKAGYVPWDIPSRHRNFRGGQQVAGRKGSERIASQQGRMFDGSDVELFCAHKGAECGVQSGSEKKNGDRRCGISNV